MNRIIRLTSLGAAAMVAACAPNGASSVSLAMPQAPAGHYDLGKEHFTAGRFGLAAQSFRAAIAQDRGDVKALNALAGTYDRMGRFDLADLYYERALALDPDHPQTLNNVGVSRMLRGDARQAVAILEQAMEKAPEEERIAQNLVGARQARIQQVAQADLAQDTPAAKPAQHLQQDGSGSWSLTTQALAHVPARPLSLLDAAAQMPPPGTPMPRPKVDMRPLPASAETVSALLPPPALAVQQVKRPNRVSCGLRIENGAGINGMAGRLGSWLRSRKENVGCIANAPSFGLAATIVSFRPEGEERARRVAALLPKGTRLEARPDQYDDVLISLGRDFSTFDSSIASKR